MPDTQQRLQQLLSDSNWSPSDKEWLLWYMENADAEELQALMLQWHKNELYTDNKIQEHISGLMWKHIAARTIGRNTPRRILPVHRVHFLKTSWFRYAAAVILIAGAAAIWYANNTSPRHFEGARNERLRNFPDIAPGTNRAILTVGNKTINLSNNKTGITVGNVITYNDGEKITDAGQLLQLTTPKGGQYQAVLPDGSKVWLNAASSIKFPSKFTGDTREVEITGEAYIEVVKNTKQPFYVTTRKTTIQVLGTSFNVNAYADEDAERTTLISGSVRVISTPTKEGEKSPAIRGDFSVARSSLLRNDEAVILTPGEQAQIPREARDDNRIKVQTTSTDEVLAWKNGLFNFNNANLQTVMRQLERWYDIEVKYAVPVRSIKFKGEMDRGLYLSDVLEFIKASGIQFKLEGKTLTILKYD